MLITISCASNIVKISRRTCIILSNNIKLYINNVLYSRKFRRNLFNFKIFATINITLRCCKRNNVEYLSISFLVGQKLVKEKLLVFHIHKIDIIVNPKLVDPIVTLYTQEELYYYFGINNTKIRRMPTACRNSLLILIQIQRFLSKFNSSLICEK